MNARTFRTVGVLAGTLCAASVAFPVTPQDKTFGSIAGIVSDTVGVPQIGASVLLYNRFDRLIQKVLTSDKGTFGFGLLPADTYTIRVSLASFLPALKRNIIVQPGMQSLLNVSLATVFSSIELVAVAPGQSSLMSDEWRWVLRSSSSTRPVLRALPEIAKVERREARVSKFSDTRGLVKVSGGDQGASATEPDLGTAFALATSFMGTNQLHVSGTLGYSSMSGAPSAALQTTYRRDMLGGSSPEVKLTMRQLSLPVRSGMVAVGGSQESSPVLRTVSATMLDSKQITDKLRFEYGASIDSVAFLDRLNYISSYGRMSYERTRGEAFQIGYASGTPPPEAFTNEGESDLEFQQDLAALAMFPRVSLRGGTARVQRTQSMEVGYHKKAGSRTYSAAAYDDDVANAAVTMVSPDGIASATDLVPDLLSDSWTLNAGNYHSRGYIASVTQDLGQHFDITMAYGSAGAIVADRGNIDTGALEELRSAIRTTRRHSLTTRVSGTIPQSGTQFIASYQWSNLDALNPSHMFMTQRMREGPGLDIKLRQPVPYFGGLPGHLEATADLRNLLAQDYSQINYAGRRLYLLQQARSVRGGLSFVF